MKKVLFILMSVIAFMSCEKAYVQEFGEEGSSGNASGGNSVLVVKTRAAETGGDATVSYPVWVYVFDSVGKCCGSSIIENSSGELVFNLGEGLYSVCAVGGCEAGKYEMPDADVAKENSPVVLKPGAGNADLMAARNTVELKDGGLNTLKLVMQRKVAKVENVKISNVPESYSSVSVTLLPLHQSLQINGSLEGDKGVETIALKKDLATGEWVNEAPVYVLPGVGETTISVEMEKDGAKKTFSYTFKEGLEANYMFSIYGTYSGDNIELSGTLEGVEWAGEKVIDFGFGDNPTTPEKPDNPQTGNAPAVGTFYQNCYVVDSEISGDRTVVTLMTTTERRDLDYGGGTADEVKAAVEGAFAELIADYGEFSGWRLPGQAEMQKAIGMTADYNEQKPESGMANMSSMNSRYFILEDGVIKVLTSSGSILTEPTKATKLRAFTKVTF